MEAISLKKMIHISISYILSMVFICLYVYNERVNEFITHNITKSNIMIYGIFVVIFFIVYLLLINAFRLRFVEKLIQTNKYISMVIYIIITGFTALLMIRCYLEETNVFAGPTVDDTLYHQHEGVSVIAMMGMLLVSIYIAGNAIQDRTQSGKVYIYLFAAALGIIYAKSFVTPNVYSQYYNEYHFDAYFNSIYSSYMGVPRSGLNTSVYGYYGLLLFPFLKIIGGGIYSFMILMAVLAFISYMCMSYVIVELVDNNIVKMFAICSLVVVNCSMHTSIYFQLNPHRVLFGSILLAYLLFGNKRKLTEKPVYIIIGVIIMMLSIIWNFETGAVYSFGVIAFYIVMWLKKHNFRQPKLYLGILGYLGIFILTNILAWSTTGLINISKGGRFLTFKQFVFPLMNQSYIGELMSGYQNGVVAWYFVAAVSLIFIANAVYNTCLNKNGCIAGWKDCYMCATGVMTLGTMSYYINRTAYGNLTIIHFYTMFMFAVLADQCIKYRIMSKGSFMKYIYKGIAALALTVIMAYTVAGIYNYSYVQNYREENDLVDTEETAGDIEQFAQACPMNTKAMGYAIPMIYYELGWDTGYYFIDFADLLVYPDSIKYIQNELDNMDEPFVIDRDALEYLEDNGVNFDKFNSCMEAKDIYYVGVVELIYWEPVK